MAQWAANRTPMPGRTPLATPYAAQGQNPYIANHQQPFTYQYQASAQQPYIANARQPGTYTRQGRTPFTYSRQGQTPFTYIARQPTHMHDKDKHLLRIKQGLQSHIDILHQHNNLILQTHKLMLYIKLHIIHHIHSKHHTYISPLQLQQERLGLLQRSKECL